MQKIEKLRKKYPQFVYKSFEYKLAQDDLRIVFDFEIKPDIAFQPEIIVKDIDARQYKKIPEKVLKNLVFHLGLAEIPTYWKISCPPKIRIEPGDLSLKQIDWWKKLILRGMGEFFYTNKINFKKPDFVKIEAGGRGEVNTAHRPSLDAQRALVPIGGGKDSAMALETAKKTKKDILCFSLNPTLAARAVAKAGECANFLEIKRRIDPKLLELNKKGFLNGHTPFSSYLAFLSALLSALFNAKFIAFANENSASEANLEYLGEQINHQYSKGFEFENDFQKYAKKYLLRDIEYFSMLRPFYEIQIAKMFTKYPEYFDGFISCNKAEKWCCECAKCLFVFLVLYPFLRKETLLSIFGKNLFKDKALLPLLLALTGEKGVKPFECVGTKKECLSALYLSIEKENKADGLPYLLAYSKEKILPKYLYLAREAKQILGSWDEKNNLPPAFERILRKELDL